MTRSWFLKERTPQCEGCVYNTERSCSLKALLDRNYAPYNIILLGENFDRGDAATHTCVGPKFRTVISQISAKIFEEYGETLRYSVMHAVGQYTDAVPAAAAIRHCSKYVHQRIFELHARLKGFHPNANTVVLAFGTGATTSLGIKRKKHDAGVVYQTTVLGTQISVIPTLSIRMLYARPELVTLVQEHAKTAWIAANRHADKHLALPASELSKDYIMPKSAEELKSAVDMIVDYYDPAKVSSASDWWAATDLETTSLDAHEIGGKIISASYSWDDGKALSFLIAHKDNTFYSVEFAMEQLRRLWGSAHKKILHNGKFDIQWGIAHNVPLNNFQYDTMLGEHYLRETARNFYSVKALAPVYARRFSGYEDELNTAIRELSSTEVHELVYEGTAEERGIVFQDPTHHFDEDDVISNVKALARMSKTDKEYTLVKKMSDRAWSRVRKAYKDAGQQPPAKPRIKKTQVKRTEGVFKDVPHTILLPYGGIDADLTRTICKEQRRLASRSRMHSHADLMSIMARFYVRGSISLANVEYEGIYIDRPLAQQYEAELAELAAKYRTKMVDAACCSADLNPDAKDAVADLLMGAFKVSYDDFPKTDKGQLSVSKDFVTKLRDDHAGKPLGDFCHALLVYRAATKAHSTYVKNILMYSDNPRHKIHGQFNLNGTTTGRLSAEKPSLQNQPEWMVVMTYKDSNGRVLDDIPGWPIKRLYTVDNSDDVIFDMDISAAEIRTLCAFLQEITQRRGSPEDPLVTAVREGRDVPSFLTSRVFAKEIWSELMSKKGTAYNYDEIYAFVNTRRKGADSIAHTLKEYRTINKRTLYGTLYGAGEWKIAQQLFGVLSSVHSEREAQLAYARSVQSMFLDATPATRIYIEETKQQIRKRKYVESLFGRRRRFPHINPSMQRELSAAYREGMNARIQSSSSDIVLDICIELERRLPEIGGKVLLTVHDSVVGQVPRAQLPTFNAFMHEIVVVRTALKFPQLPVPFSYNLVVGPNYCDTVPIHKLDNLNNLTESERRIVQAMGIAC